MAHTIFYITPSVELLGARVSLFQLVANLDTTRFRPLVICPREGPLSERLRDINVQTRIVRIGKWRKVKYWPLIPQAIFNLTEIGREEGVGLWHSNEFWSFPYAYQSAKRLGTPAICHFRCSRSATQVPPQKLRKYFVHKADQIIAISESQKNIFKNMPEVASKLSVVPNGLDLSKFSRLETKAFRKEFNVDDNEFLVGMVGLISEHKGVEEYLIACAKVAEKIPNLKIVIVGPDHSRIYLKRIKKLCAKLQIENRMIFTGFREDIPNIMSSLDLLITPSRQEAFGRVLLEAMAVGTPVIASDVGGIPEVISSNDVGILVPPENPGRFAEEMIGLLKNENRRKVIAANARRLVEEKFSIQLHVQRIQSIYDEFLSRRPNADHREL